MVGVPWRGFGRAAGLVVALALIYAAIALASLLVGPFADIGVGDLVEYLLGSPRPTAESIIDYRLSRLVAATLVGAGLAIAGATLQHVLGNPLADPYIVGVSAGSALTVLLMLALGVASPLALYTGSLAGGVAALVIVLAVASVIGYSSLSLIIAGVSISYFLSGLSLILIYKAYYKLPAASIWLFGTVAYASGTSLKATMALVAAGALIILASRREISSLLLGEEVAESLGVRVRSTRLRGIVASALIVSALVALAGPVGFIGLVAPWISRILVGSYFTRLLTVAVLVGAVLGSASDLMVKAMPGGEIPLTAVTAIYGAPLLFYLSVRHSYRGA